MHLAVYYFTISNHLIPLLTPFHPPHMPSFWFIETLHFQRKVTGLFLFPFLTCSWLQNSMPEEIRITKLTDFRSNHRLHLAVVHLSSITISWNWTEKSKLLSGFLEFKRCRHHRKSNGKSTAAITRTPGQRVWRKSLWKVYMGMNPIVAK